METLEEIAVLKRRIDGTERELEQIKNRLSALEAQVALPIALERVAAVAPATPPETPDTLRRADEAATRPAAVEEPPPLPPPVEIEIPPDRPRPHPWREWLEPLQLWPPSGEDNAEVRLAAWWATRVGALLAVIGVAFLGIYVSRNTPAWVRWAELVLVTAGVIRLGSWLERKVPKFGAVVFGAGLALAYYCAFAAYAVRAVTIIHDPVLATAFELVAVAGIFAVAWRRNSEVVASMAVALGHVTAFLALREETAGFGPWVVLLLGTAAVSLRLLRDWVTPSALALPLAWLFLGEAAFFPAGQNAMPVRTVWFWAGNYFALFFAMDWLRARRGRALTGFDRAWQTTNSSLAVATGFFAAAQAGGPALTEFYFGSGVVLVAAALIWKKAGEERLVPVWLCKASGLIALGIVHEFDGPARCLGLLAQAFVMLESARQSRLQSLRVATVIVGLVALGFFVGDLRLGESLVAGRTLAQIVFLGGAMTFTGLLERRLLLPWATSAVGAALVGGAGVLAVSMWASHGWTPALMVALTLLLAGSAAIVRAWSAAGIAGVIALVAAHEAMIAYRTPGFSAEQLWLNELALLALAAATGPAMAHVGDETDRRRLRGALGALALGTLVIVLFKGLPAAPALALVTGLITGLVAFAPQTAGWPLVALTAPLVALASWLYLVHGGSRNNPWAWVSLGLAWASPVWLAVSPRRLANALSSAWRAVTPPALTTLATLLTILTICEDLRGERRLLALTVAAMTIWTFAWRLKLRPALEASWALWVVAMAGALGLGVSASTWAAAAAMWAPAVFMTRGAPGSATGIEPPPWWRAYGVGIQTTLAAVTATALALDCGGPGKFLALAAVVAGSFAAWRFGGVGAARPAALVQLGVAWIAAIRFADTAGAQDWSLGLLAVVGTAVLVTGLPFALEENLGEAPRGWLRWSTAAGGLMLAGMVFVAQRGEVAHFATVGCGLSGGAVFLAGLLRRSRPHRLCGLAALALCVPRAFAVDLHSTLHRILAFVALGAVLLWVGFSYHRFRHLVTGENPDEKKL